MAVLKLLNKSSFVCALMVFSFFSNKAIASDQCDVLKVSSSADWRPFIYTNPDGSKGGQAVDILNVVAKKTGILLEYSTQPVWVRIVKDVQEGETDLLLTLLKTNDRLNSMVFSDWWAKMGVVLVTKKGNEFEFNGPKSLSGKDGAIIRGMSLPSDAPDYLSSEKLIRVSEWLALYRLLDNDRVDYVIVSEDGFLRLLSTIGAQDNVSVLKNSGYAANLHMAFSKQSRCLHLLEPLNAAIAAFKNK